MQESVAAGAQRCSRAAEASIGVAGGFPRKATTCTSTCRRARCPRTARRAGVALTCAMLSAVTGIPARSDVAMTGEVTLRGTGAAHRRREGKAAGRLSHGHHRDPMLPAENERDLEKIDERHPRGAAHPSDCQRGRGAGAGAERADEDNEAGRMTITKVANSSPPWRS